MQGPHHFIGKAKPQFRLAKRGPRYTRQYHLRSLLDWDFLYQATQPLCGTFFSDPDGLPLEFYEG